MSKDAVIKARGEEFDAALRVELARQSVEHRRKMLESAKLEYEDAGNALRAIRASTTALEASVVAELGKDRVERAPDAVDVFDKARESEGLRP